MISFYSKTHAMNKNVMVIYIYIYIDTHTHKQGKRILTKKQALQKFIRKQFYPTQCYLDNFLKKKKIHVKGVRFVTINVNASTHMCNNQ
jgi:hypothetical protein